MVTEVPGPAPVKRRAPTLYAIITIKLIRGALLLLLALGVYSLADNDLPHDFRSFLERIQADPESKFFADLAERIQNITPTNVYWVASGTAFYSLFSLVEAVGLMLRAGWAGWLAIGESAFFVPIEVYELIRGFSKTVLVILVLNVLIVWYLFSNRKRLFRHHQQRPPETASSLPPSHV